MTPGKFVAFFAPIKPPDHPIPSGDRLIAQNLVKALTLGGNSVEVASKYICYSKRSGADYLNDRKSGALLEADRLIQTYLDTAVADRPDLWMTYHPYCKAPDWIGPKVAAALNIPYVTVEAARTGQGGPEDEWAAWRAEAQPGILGADRHIVFKPSDRKYLNDLLGSDQRLRDLAPFVDLESLNSSIDQTLPEHWMARDPVLITTGMMRKGKKDQNFYMLANILSGLVDLNWNLLIVGGGPEEEAIRQAFSTIPSDRLHWTGQVEHGEVLGWMARSDVFIWPGWKEPIGMVYLEAQSQKLPVLAYESMGVPLVVENGSTGLLAPEDDIEAMRNNARKLLANKTLISEMGENARLRVVENHSIEAAANRLNEILGEFH